MFFILTEHDYIFSYFSGLNQHEKIRTMKSKSPLLVVFLLCFWVFSTQAQEKYPRQSLPLAKYNENVNTPLTAKEKEMLLDVYGDKLQEYVLSKPQRLKDIKNILRNRVEIIEIPDAKNHKECELLSSISLFNNYNPSLKRDFNFNTKTFNPLKYNFKFYAAEGALYKVDNTNYFISIKPQYQ